MVAAIIFAHVWGTIEMALLGSFARTLRLRTVLLALAAGFYLIEPFTLLLEYTWIKAASGISGIPVGQVLGFAGYAVDPFLEELVKLSPVALALLLLPSARRQWSLTDCVLLAAATGAGFAVAEDLFRFSAAAGKANPNGSGWTLATSMALPFVPGFLTSLTSWLPPGVVPDDVFFPGSPSHPWIDLHLAWSSIGGLAVGLLCLERRRGSVIVGILLIIYIGADHSASNARAGWWVPPLDAVRGLLPLMPALALGVAWWLDRERQSAISGSEVMLTAATGTSPIAALFSAALKRPPSSAVRVFDFIRLRRLYYRAEHAGDPAAAALREAVIARRDSLDAWLESPNASSPIDEMREAVRTLFARLRSQPTPLLIVWAVTLAPCVLYLIVGGWPQTSGVQAAMMNGVGWTLVRLASLVGLAFLGWRLAAAVRLWPRVQRMIGEDAASYALRLGITAGGCAFLGASLTRVFAPTDAFSPLLKLHGVEDPPGPGQLSGTGGGAAGAQMTPNHGTRIPPGFSVRDVGAPRGGTRMLPGFSLRDVGAPRGGTRMPPGFNVRDVGAPRGGTRMPPGFSVRGLGGTRGNTSIGRGQKGEGAPVPASKPAGSGASDAAERASTDKAAREAEAAAIALDEHAAHEAEAANALGEAWHSAAAADKPAAAAAAADAAEKAATAAQAAAAAWRDLGNAARASAADRAADDWFAAAVRARAKAGYAPSPYRLPPPVPPPREGKT